MKIEHWHSRANYAGEQLDYSNLLGWLHGDRGERTAVPNASQATSLFRLRLQHRLQLPESRRVHGRLQPLWR
jgi:hypothetical protein